MHAWQAGELGDPREVVRSAVVAVPEPEPGEVLIEVAATALNLPDVLLCRGTYQERPEPPFVPGCEVVGTVAASAATETAVGERVVAMPRLPHGGLAEYCVAPARDCFGVPPSIGDAAAAALSVAYQTAWLGLRRRAGLTAGEVLLVHGAAGGVGSAAVQLGTAWGATVIATARGEEKVEVVAGLGADAVIDLREEDFVAAVRERTGGRGADVVVDPVGGEVFDRSRRCVAWEGRLLTVGFASGELPVVPANHVLLKNYSLVGLHCGAYREHDPVAMREAHRDLLRMHETGEIEPLLFPLASDVTPSQALGMLEDGSTYGKLVVDPAGSNSSIAKPSASRA